VREGGGGDGRAGERGHATVISAIESMKKIGALILRRRASTILNLSKDEGWFKALTN
jgi:hypothetical protein